jgi:hypothetical protein
VSHIVALVSGRRHLIAFVLLAVATTACQLRLRVDVTVDRTGGGHLAVAVAADEELLAQADDADVDPLAAVAEAGRELAPHGWRTDTRIGEDGSRSVVLSHAFDSPEALADLSADLAEGLAAPEVAPLEPFALALGEDTLTLTGAAGLEPTPEVTELGLQPADAVRVLQERDAVAYTVHVTLPGEVLAAQGGTIEGSTVTWRIAPGERVELRAVAVRPGPSLWPAIVSAVTGALVGAVVVLRVSARRRRALAGLAP